MYLIRCPMQLSACTYRKLPFSTGRRGQIRVIRVTKSPSLQYKCRILRTCNIKSKCCIPLVIIDTDNLGASQHKYKFLGEYLFRIFRHRPLKLVKQWSGAKLFKGSYLKNDKDMGAKMLWVFITSPEDC